MYRVSSEGALSFAPLVTLLSIHPVADCAKMSDHNLPKTRKKWIRPITGAASSNVPVLGSSDIGESEIEEARISYQPAERDHSLHESSEIGTRGPSPSSSVASGRPLEWDSGADVGYHLLQITETLSPVEQIALKHMKDGGQSSSTPKDTKNVAKEMLSTTKIKHSTPVTDNFVPPLNLDALISERKTIPKKYKSLDNLYSNINREKVTRGQLPAHQTGSASSLTTVVSVQKNKLKKTPRIRNKDFQWLLDKQTDETCKQLLIQMFNTDLECDSESSYSEQRSEYSDTRKKKGKGGKFKEIDRAIYQIEPYCSTDRCVEVKVGKRPESSASLELKGSDSSSKYFSSSAITTSEHLVHELNPSTEDNFRTKQVEVGKQEEKKRKKHLKRSEINVSSSTSTHKNPELVTIVPVESKPDKRLQMLRAVEQEISPIQAERLDSSKHRSVSNNKHLSRDSSKSTISSVTSESKKRQSEDNSKKGSKSIVTSVKSDIKYETADKSIKTHKSDITSVSGPGPETGAIRKVICREEKIKVKKTKESMQEEEKEAILYDQVKEGTIGESCKAEGRSEQIQTLQEELIQTLEQIHNSGSSSNAGSHLSTASQKSIKPHRSSDGSQTNAMDNPDEGEHSNIENKQKKNMTPSSEHSITKSVQDKPFVEIEPQHLIEQPLHDREQSKDNKKSKKLDKPSVISSLEVEGNRSSSSAELKSDTPVTSSQSSKDTSHERSTSSVDSEASYLSQLRKEIELQRLNEYLWLSYLIGNIKSRKQRLLLRREEKRKQAEAENSSKSSQSNKIATSRANKATQVTSLPKPDAASSSTSQPSAILSGSESRQQPTQLEGSSKNRPDNSVSNLEAKFQNLTIESSSDWSKDSYDGSFKDTSSSAVSDTQRQTMNASIVNKYRQSILEDKFQDEDDTKENDEPDGFSNFSFLGNSLEELTLQEYLRRSHPDFIRHAEYRSEFIADLRSRRCVRAEKRRKHLVLQLANPELASQPLLPATLPPPPLAERRLFTQKQMRQRTLKKCKNLQEAKEREEKLKLKLEKEVNRHMASIYRRKLQKHVLSKKPDLSNSMSVITLS